MGSLLRVNNVSGVPYINIGDTSNANTTDSNIIELYKERRNNIMVATISLIRQLLVLQPKLVRQEFIGLV